MRKNISIQSVESLISLVTKCFVKVILIHLENKGVN